MVSRLLSLPRELRDQIYDLVLFSQIPRTIGLVPVVKPTEEGKLAASILRVNKQIHTEASRVLYSNITVVLPMKYLFQPRNMRERTEDYVIFRAPPTPEMMARSSNGMIERPPADSLIYKSVLRRAARIRYQMACRIYSSISSATAFLDLYSCPLDDVAEFITALCGNDTTVESPIPKSFRLEIFSLNSQQTPEDAKDMEKLVHRTLKQRSLRGPLGKLRGYRDVGVQCSTFWKRVGGREVLHEGISYQAQRVGGARRVRAG